MRFTSFMNNLAPGCRQQDIDMVSFVDVVECVGCSVVFDPADLTECTRCGQLFCDDCLVDINGDRVCVYDWTEGDDNG